MEPARTAMNAGHVTPVKGDLVGIQRARALSQATVRNMWQNLGFAFVSNALSVPIAKCVVSRLRHPAFAADRRAGDEFVVTCRHQWSKCRD